MPSEHYELPISNNSLTNITIVPSGSSLIDILNQQSCQTICENSQPTIIFDEAAKSRLKQTQNLRSNDQHNKTLSLTNNDDFSEHDKISTLFNTTGRERNSTGPLKEWLYAHQHCPYPNETDKQELMKKTNMSVSQITIWFTNARAKMRKENTLPVNFHEKKKKEKQQDNSNYLEEIFKLPISFDGQISQTNIFSSLLLNDKRIVMAYSCLNSEQINNLHHIVSIYPNQLSISDCVDDHTTHLIIRDEEETLLCPLTIKLFQSIARHLYIVTYRWIVECLKQNDIIDEMNYEVRGDIPLGQYHDGMRKSRLSKTVKLFQNCQFFILCDGCQDKMSKIELASLIQLCHGSLLETFPLTTTTDNSVLTIVLCNNLLPFNSSNQQQLFELSRSNGVHFIIPEWIIESIVQFVLQPFDSYEEKF